jgi:hypothetical protein
MGAGYYWSTAFGVLGILAIMAAASVSVVGMVRRHPDDRLPPYVGASFALMVLGACSFIAALLFMVGSAQ